MRSSCVKLPDDVLTLMSQVYAGVWRQSVAESQGHAEWLKSDVP